MPSTRGVTSNENLRKRQRPEQRGEPALEQSFSGTLANEYGDDDCPALEGALEKFLELEDILTEADLMTDFDFPKIVVIGNQSAGKSTVLELLTGISLPKDCTIATRCPINIRLKRREEARMELEYIDNSGTRKRNENLTRQSVHQFLSRAQEEMLPEGADITASAITLRVEGPLLPSFSVTDLPGLNYSRDTTSTEIEDLIRQFIFEKNTLIIIVQPAVDDIAATPAIKLARAVDPNYDRTMCVLTKPDKLGEEALENGLLDLVANKNKSLQLKKGFVVIKGPGADSERGGVQQYKDEESEYFENHTKFKRLLKEKKAGTDALIEHVSNMMKDMAQKNVNQLWSDIQLRYKCAEKEAGECASLIPDENSKRIHLSKVIRDMNKELEKLALEEINCNECKGYHIHCLCQKVFERFSKDIEQAIKTNEFLAKEIAKEYDDHRGPEPRGFTRLSVYKNKVSEKMQEIQELSTDVLNEVSEIVRRALFNVLEKYAQSFFLLTHFKELSMEVFEKQKEAGQKYLDTFFKMEEKPYVSDYNLRKIQVAEAAVGEAVESSEAVNQSGRRRQLFCGMVGTIFLWPKTILLYIAFWIYWAVKKALGIDNNEHDATRENSTRNLLETRSGHSRYQPEVTRTVTAYQQYIQHTCALMTDAVPKIVEFHLVTSLVDELATTYMNKDHELLRSMRDDPGLERKREEAFAKKEMWKNVLERCNSLNMFNK